VSERLLYVALTIAVVLFPFLLIRGQGGNRWAFTLSLVCLGLLISILVSPGGSLPLQGVYLSQQRSEALVESLQSRDISDVECIRSSRGVSWACAWQARNRLIKSEQE